jgi:hypothetical protein
MHAQRFKDTPEILAVDEWAYQHWLVSAKNYSLWHHEIVISQNQRVLSAVMASIDSVREEWC